MKTIDTLEKINSEWFNNFLNSADLFQFFKYQFFLKILTLQAQNRKYSYYLLFKKK